MVERKPSEKGTKTSATPATGKASEGFTDEERAAMRERAQEQSAQKFKTRYATFGFSDAANLDEGAMWPTAFALTQLTAAEEVKIGALVKKAVS